MFLLLYILHQIQERYAGERVDKGEHYEADPTGARTGQGVGPQLAETIERVASDAEALLHKVTPAVNELRYIFGS